MIHESNILEADDLNVPVESFLMEPDSESPKWRWSASLYMPRKSRIEEDYFNVVADTKEEILDLVRRVVVPIYEAAVHNLSTHGENYFFRKEAD